MPDYSPGSIAFAVQQPVVPPPPVDNEILFQPGSPNDSTIARSGSANTTPPLQTVLPATSPTRPSQQSNPWSLSQYVPSQNQSQMTVGPEQTVAGQASRLIEQDGPLMQQARGGAMQMANARGLTNSSLSVGAAQDAVMGRAVDIAKQDAGTNFDASKFNASQRNDLSKFNAEQSNLERRILVGASAELDKITKTMPGQFSGQLANTTMTGVNAIMSDGGLNSDQKRAAINNIIAYANTQVEWASKFYDTTIPRLTTPGVSR